MNLHQIVLSPRGPRSASTEVSHVFLEAFRAKYPRTTIDIVNVSETVAPEFDGSALDANIRESQEQCALPSKKLCGNRLKALPYAFTRQR